MSMFRIFDVAGSAVSAQSQRLNVVASNLAVFRAGRQATAALNPPTP